MLVQKKMEINEQLNQNTKWYQNTNIKTNYKDLQKILFFV